MSEKPKPDATKTIKPKRPSTVNVPTSSRAKIVTKEKSINPAQKFQDTAVLEEIKKLPNLDDKYREMAYSRFMSDVLDECVIKEKIKREITPIDVVMTQLADRFRKTIEQLDKTNKRLKDISFVVEQKRLLDLRNNDNMQIYKTAEDTEDLPKIGQAYLDKVNLRHVGFGFDKNSGHKQLLDTVNDAIDGLEKIKNESNLEMVQFQDFDGPLLDLDDDKSEFDIESIKSEFEVMFPKISSQLLQEATEKFAKMFDNGFDDVDSDDD